MYPGAITIYRLLEPIALSQLRQNEDPPRLNSTEAANKIDDYIRDSTKNASSAPPSPNGFTGSKPTMGDQPDGNDQEGELNLEGL